MNEPAAAPRPTELAGAITAGLVPANPVTTSARLRGVRSLQMATVAWSAPLPESMTTELTTCFAQSVFPAGPARPIGWAAVGALDVQCAPDGSPLTVLIWKGRCVERALSPPPLVPDQRAMFALQRLRSAPVPAPTEQRTVVDLERRCVRVQLVETLQTTCVPLATRTLAELTSSGELAALWMLEIEGVGANAQPQKLQAMAAQRVRRAGRISP